MANTVNIGDYQYTLYDSTGKAAAVVRDKTKSSYDNIPSTITVSGRTYNVTNLTACFSGCSSLTAAPTIPSSVTMMDECFSGCSSLVNAPVLPENASSLNECFSGCSSLVNPPALPTYAQNLRGCFSGCSALTSAPTIPFFAQVMDECFSGCSSLVDAPAIPDRVYSMTSCFSGCSALTTAPTIPSGVTNMASCFANCSALTTAPTIPSGVNSLQWGFGNCSSLTGNVTINANAATFSVLFSNTQKGIWLTGSSTKLSDYAATATNNNVYVGEIPLSYSLTIERVVGDGGTVQDPEGLFAHIQLTINWADFTENSLDAITLKNGMASTSPTWYTDAAKTSTITLPNWRPSASTTIHCWLAITSATHVFSVTVADRYHTGVVISFTVPQQFRTMDFLAGGQGVAFGMPATQNGMFINMDLAIKEYSNIVKNIYDVFYPVGSYYETNLPSAIPSGQSTPTDADLENLGATWFDPNFAWGGTWTSEQIKDDYVVDEINDGIWIGKKWASGKFELYIYYSGVPTGGKHYWTSPSNVLHGYRVEGFVFPQGWKPLGTTYNVTVNWNIGSGFSMDSTYGNDANGFNIYALATQADVTNVQAKVLVTGYWKSFGSPTKYRWHRTA